MSFDPLEVLRSTGPIPVQPISVSSLLAGPAQLASSLPRLPAGTSQERRQWAVEAKRRRAEERLAAEGVPLTIDALLDKMGWSEEYAEHLVQPYCDCDIDREGGWEYCEHARDLGLAG